MSLHKLTLESNVIFCIFMSVFFSFSASFNCFFRSPTLDSKLLTASESVETTFWNLDIFS